MCWSEKGNSGVLRKFCMQKMWREYLRGSGAGTVETVGNSHILGECRLKM